MVWSGVFGCGQSGVYSYYEGMCVHRCVSARVYASLFVRVCKCLHVRAYLIKRSGPIRSKPRVGDVPGGFFFNDHAVFDLPLSLPILAIRGGHEQLLHLLQTFVLRLRHENESEDHPQKAYSGKQPEST